VRAIPTRVGKSQCSCFGHFSSSGHPHAGGEIQLLQDGILCQCGPSPRGWGNLRCRLQRLAGLRAIPTRVGKSCVQNEMILSSAGHPHAGGEIRIAGGIARNLAGPSPRGWGNRHDPESNDARGRAIPTRVGKSPRKKIGVPPFPGHPHAGGEIWVRSWAGVVICGPSPRGWGNPRRKNCRSVNPRAIPTRVGKSAVRMEIRSRQAGHPHAGGEIL